MPIKIGNTTVIDDSRGAVFNSLTSSNGITTNQSANNIVFLSNTGTINCSLGHYFRISNTETNILFTNVPQVGLYAITIDIVQSGGTLQLVWPVNVSWLGEVPTGFDTVPQRMIVNLYTIDSGISWAGSLQYKGTV